MIYSLPDDVSGENQLPCLLRWNHLADWEKVIMVYTRTVTELKSCRTSKTLLPLPVEGKS